MKRQDAREAYQYNSATASELCRTLSLAAVGIIWVFAVSREDGSKALPRALAAPAFLVICSLALDLVQYLSGTLIWGRFQRKKELEGVTEQDDFKAPRWINWSGQWCFGLKQAAMVGTYLLLLRYAWKSLTG